MKTVGIEAGNSNIKIGLFEKSKIVELIVIPVEKIKALKLPPSWIKESPFFTGLASVIPHINSLLKEKFKQISRDIWIVRPSDCGIPLRIKNPESVGVDRVLNCKAAIGLFGPDVIVIDIGTAITIDYASRKGFMGGVIMPGPSLWSYSLTRTGMIKKIEEKKGRVPGKDTGEAIYLGIKYGISGAINNIVSEYKSKYPYAKVVLAGGAGEIFSRYIKFDIKRKNLALEGLGMVLYERYGNNSGRCL